MSNIYELPRVTLADVPRVLRAIADEIEAGKHGQVDSAAIVVDNAEGKLVTFGAGAADYYRAIALFGLAGSSLKREYFSKL